MPSEGPAGHKRPSGRAASIKAAAVGGAGGCSGGMPAPAACTPLPGGMGRGALSGSSCAVGRPGVRGPRSGTGVRPTSMKAVSGGAAAAAVAAAVGAESAAPQQQEEVQQQAWEAATAAGLSDVDDKENAGAAEAAAAGAPAVRQMPAASKAATAVSNAGEFSDWGLSMSGRSEPSGQQFLTLDCLAALLLAVVPDRLPNRTECLACMHLPSQPSTMRCMQSLTCTTVCCRCDCRCSPSCQCSELQGPWPVTWLCEPPAHHSIWCNQQQQQGHSSSSSI